MHSARCHAPACARTHANLLASCRTHTTAQVAKSVHYCEATKAFTTMEYRDVTALAGLPTSAGGCVRVCVAGRRAARGPPVCRVCQCGPQQACGACSKQAVWGGPRAQTVKLPPWFCCPSPPPSAVYPIKDANGNLLTTEYGMCLYKDSQTITVQVRGPLTPHPTVLGTGRSGWGLEGWKWRGAGGTCA